MYLEFNKIFQGVNQIENWTLTSLSQYFQLPCETFTEVMPGVIFATQKIISHATGFLLPGAIFETKLRQAQRNLPPMLYGSVYQAQVTPLAEQAEHEIRACLESGPVIFEEKLPGICVRFFRLGDVHYLATRRHVTPFGELRPIPPLKIAKRFIQQQCPRTIELVDAGYGLIFELISPGFKHLLFPSPTEALVLVDILEQNKFLNHQQKERLASKYHLELPRVITTQVQTLSAQQFLKKVKSLEYQCHQLGIEGVVAKASRDDSDQVFLKIKSQSVRCDHLGTAEIPKRFIQEAIQTLKMEVPRTQFVQSGYALTQLYAELADDFLISPGNQAKIEARYQLEQQKALQEITAAERARELWQAHSFQSRKEIVAATGDEDRRVRSFLFEFWEESRH